MSLQRLIRVITLLGVMSPLLATEQFTEGEKAYIGGGCIACHGTAGRSPNPQAYPTLASLDRDYLVQQLTAFREGERSNPMMSPMAAGLSDQQIQLIAGYLSALN